MAFRGCQGWPLWLFIGSTNVDSFDVYINNDYYGSDVNLIQITTNDTLRIQVVKNDDTIEGKIIFDSKLV